MKGVHRLQILIFIFIVYLFIKSIIKENKELSYIYFVFAIINSIPAITQIKYLLGI